MKREPKGIISERKGYIYKKLDRIDIAMIETRSKKLRVCLAQDQLEIEEALSLRYDVFNLELNEGLPESYATCKDRDEFDLYCDHLIVVDGSKSRKVVGTYRILRQETAKQNIGFYSQREFELSAMQQLSGNIAETGRSCVHSDYRDGSVIRLLWAGLRLYMCKYHIRHLFGCASVHQPDPKTVSRISSYLRQKNQQAKPGFDIYPRKTHELKGFNANYQEANEKDVRKLVPVLIKGYLRGGAYIYPIPAYDPVFGTSDFFVLFDLNYINERYDRYYDRQESIVL